MRIAIASFGQETSSFSPLPTTLDQFRDFGIREGADALEHSRGVGVLGGFQVAAEEEGFDFTPLSIIHGWAGAGGIVTADALDFFAEKIAAGLRQAMPVDGMYFSIHGAAQSEQVDDAEGYLLKLARDVIGPDVPIVAPMDHHANITQLKIDMLTGLVGHLTQPHDPYDTGRRAAKLLFSILRGEIRPTMAFHKIPMMTHQERFLTNAGPMKEWFDMAREFETRPGVVSVSNFPEQPWLDAEEGGWASVVITDDDMPLARRLSAELADKAWSLRDALWKMDSIPIEAAVRRAVEAPRGLVVMTDIGDTVWGGAAGDSTHILAELLRQNVAGPALVPIADAPAVDAAVRAGLGNQVTLRVGATLDPVFNRPVEVTGRVAGIGGGWLRAETVGLRDFDMGRAVLLEAGGVRLMISERRGIGGNHPVVYQHFGIDPADAKMVVIKTTSNWQYYNPWMSEVIRVDTPGATSSHLERFEWKRMARPFWPLDRDMRWQAGGNR